MAASRYLVPEDCGRAHCLASIAPGELPTERLIFPAGDFVTTKGTFLFDAEAAAAVMADWNEWTGGLPQKGSSDYEHDQSKDNIPGHLKLDSSSYDLEVRDGALWTVNIRWTDLAAGMIERREKRFTSPWWLYEKATKRIIRYINFGLVSMPATIAQPELITGAAASRSFAQVPDLFAGYASAMASASGAASGANAATTDEAAAAASAAAAAAGASAAAAGAPAATTTTSPTTTTTPQGETATMTMKPDYKDPGFKPTQHGWDLRDMTSSALHNMQCSVRLHNEVPMLAAAMGLPKHVEHLAEHVAHCAAAMVHHMVMGDEMPMDMDTDASKLPAEVAAKVNAAIAACKAVKIGAAKGSRAAAADTASALASAQAETAAAKEALVAAKAETAAALAGKVAAEKAADQVKYDDLIEKNRSKITKGAQEAWVRANVIGSAKLAEHIATLKPVAVSGQHQQGSAGIATAHQSAEDRQKIIQDVELPAATLAAWVETGGHPQRLFNLQEQEAKRLGLVS